MRNYSENDFTFRLAFFYAQQALGNDINVTIHATNELEAIEHALAEFQPNFTDNRVADFEQLKVALSSSK